MHNIPRKDREDADDVDEDEVSEVSGGFTDPDGSEIPRIIPDYPQYPAIPDPGIEPICPPHPYIE